MKKIFLSCLTITFSFMLFITNVSAQSQIPDTMPANTLIKYISSEEYVILTGEDKKEHEFNEEKYIEAQSNIVNENVDGTIIETYPSPEKDMLVKYGSDGEINRIYSPKNILLEYNTEIVNTTENQAPQGRASLTDPTWKTVAKWGSFPNYLYKQVTHPSFYKYKGQGRATTFEDSKGNMNNSLHKGDVATKKAYDNCAHGTTINVTAQKKGSTKKYSKNMTKSDIGGMPNAIVDIWKTGVEYWGYKYYDGLSLSGNVTILHD